jgi:hypothetical protein
MKRVVLFCEVMALLILGAFFVCQAQAGEPKILIPQNSFDFGLVPTGSVVSHYYLTKNVGTDTLRIRAVSPG